MDLFLSSHLIRTSSIIVNYITLLLLFICRLFLTMDPSRGEISRAMRNRGIEVALLPEVREIEREHDYTSLSLVRM